jgi:predicted nucleotide-binding protein
MTIIEKLEHFLSDADYVFALFTPDDLVQKPTKARRARQNVVFEFGYVLGMLGRTSGRVFFLHKGDVELPSDLHGVIYIDISNGVDAAGEDIRRELEDLLA